ncbi:MAG: bacteriophage abortive infection AbiH family protein [Oscillospiraceae bacterium]|nr:bacteriophage abortive infection AbiH family protein [Oscillospiraceae bacterium]
MNITFLIGNGFDLNVGLHTKYEHFLSYYSDVPHDEDPRLIRFKKDIKKDLKSWADAEKMMGEYTLKYKDGDENDFIFCKKDFQEKLSDYLKNQEKRINYDTFSDDIIAVFKNSLLNFKSYLPIARQEIIDSAMKSHLSENWHYNFITFNYTEVFDKCIKIVKDTNIPISVRRLNYTYSNNIANLIHIHGTVHKNMIMGVDNEEQILNEKIRSNKKFKKRFIKPITNEGLKELNDTNATNMINNSRVVCVFGMSLGETDTTWWKNIATWLQNSDVNQLIIFIKDDDWNDVNPEDVFASEEAVWERFYRLTDFPEDKQELFEERIHIAVNTNLFKIDLTPKAEETEPQVEKELITV